MSALHVGAALESGQGPGLVGWICWLQDSIVTFRGVSPSPQRCTLGGRSSWDALSPCRFGDGYMITVRTKSSLNIKEVVRFFNRNFPEAVLKVSSRWWQCCPLLEAQAAFIPQGIAL